jgi:ubiquinone/menaquinone biosynthesis C-methylase UbiE
MSIPFDQMAAGYDAMRGLPPQSALDDLAACIITLTHATPATRFLEPGVGTGRIALPLVQRGHHYTGLDLSPMMLDQFRRKLAGIAARPDLVLGDATSLPFKAASFDVVLTSELLYHVPDWHRALAEIARVLKPDGNYLYCYEEVERSATAQEIDSWWCSLLAGHGFEPLWENYISDDGVLDALRQQAAVHAPHTAALWQTNRTLEDHLDSYSKLRSLYPNVPDPLFSTLLDTLRAWAIQRYGSQDLITVSTTKYLVRLIRL